MRTRCSDVTHAVEHKCSRGSNPRKTFEMGRRGANHFPLRPAPYVIFNSLQASRTLKHTLTAKGVREWESERPEAIWSGRQPEWQVRAGIRPSPAKRVQRQRHTHARWGDLGQACSGQTTHTHTRTYAHIHTFGHSMQADVVQCGSRTAARRCA